MVKLYVLAEPQPSYNETKEWVWISSHRYTHDGIFLSYTPHEDRAKYFNDNEYRRILNKIVTRPPRDLFHTIRKFRVVKGT